MASIHILTKRMASCKITQLKTLTSEAMVNIEHKLDAGDMTILITLWDPSFSREKHVSDSDIFHFVWKDHETHEWFDANILREELIEICSILDKPKDLMATLETQPAIELLDDGTCIATFNVSKGKRSYPICINLKSCSEDRGMMIGFEWESAEMCDRVARLEDDLRTRDVKIADLERKLAEYEVAADTHASHV